MNEDVITLKMKIYLVSMFNQITTYFFHPLLFTIAKECSKQTAVQVVQDSDQKVFIELKC